MRVSAFPPEILEELIDRLHSTTALLSFGLVCRRALIKTRHILFSNLEFTKNEDFEQFLELVDAPWTSITLAVKEICLTDLFHPHHHEYRCQIGSTRIASNLANVKSLCIFVHRLWPIGGWKVIPRSILDVIFQLKIHDLQLDTLGMSTAQDMVMLFRRLPSIKTLAFQRLRYDDVKYSDLSDHLSIFRRPLHFRMLDNDSLAFLKDVLDPSINPDLNVTVHTFHLRAPDLPTYGACNPLTWRFLQHVGHSIERLLITFQEPFIPLLLDEAIKYVEPTQVSRCTNVRMLYIGFPRFAYVRTRQDPIPLLVSAMWKILSALPSPNDLEEFWFKHTPYETSPDKSLSKLGFFESPNCLYRFRSMFPNLKLIKIILAIHHPENASIFLEAVRRVNGLRELEADGIVELVTFDIEKHVGCHSILEGCDLFYHRIK
ncbi:hypothetical protein F5887DRAFT_1071049 [Amanita rubescens]|nr:hypothetical protein F5887DRAFT_1071049 [Amanita rubescens]